MPRKRIQKLMPNPDVIMKSSIVNIFGNVLNDPSLWHVNRRSVAGAFAVGMFFAFMPVPFQMILAAFFAILFRVNILISVPLVWITNPITIPPMFYFCYLVGVKVLGIQTGDFSIELSVEWWLNGLMAIWQPLLLGSFIVASVASFLGYTLVQLFWRYHLWQHMKQRKKKTMTPYPQHLDQTNDIVAIKVQKTVNKKVLRDMKKAVDAIHQDDKKNKYFALKGMAILLIIIVILVFVFFK